jgi:hypothetical protein
MISIMFLPFFPHTSLGFVSGVLHFKRMNYMDLFIESEYEKSDDIRVAPYKDKLVKLLYPGIYGRLTGIGLLQNLVETEPKITPLRSILMKMRSELDELCRQEETIIFPLLIRLEQEDKKADSCKPFKIVKYHYTYLISMLQQFKTLLLQLAANSQMAGSLMVLKDMVVDFETLLVKVQINKEQLLFKRFRNCNNGCKAL